MVVYQTFFAQSSKPAIIDPPLSRFGRARNNTRRQETSLPRKTIGHQNVARVPATRAIGSDLLLSYDGDGSARSHDGCGRGVGTGMLGPADTGHARRIGIGCPPLGASSVTSPCRHGRRRPHGRTGESTRKGQNTERTRTGGIGPPPEGPVIVVE